MCRSSKGDTPVGILTARDIRFEKNLDQPISALMTTELVTVEPGVNRDARQELLHAHRIEKLLVVDGSKLVGLITIKDLLQAERNPLAVKDGAGGSAWAPRSARAPTRKRARPRWSKRASMLIVVDTAHGHSKGVLDTVRLTRKRHPKVADHRAATSPPPKPPRR